MPMRNIRQFHCPHCGYIRTLLDGEPDITICPACNDNGTYRWVPPKLPDFYIQQIPDMNDPCAGCSNNPKNGGSGICLCVLPYMRGPNKITFSSGNSSGT